MTRRKRDNFLPLSKYLLLQYHPVILFEMVYNDLESRTIPIVIPTQGLKSTEKLTDFCVSFFIGIFWKREIKTQIPGNQLSSSQGFDGRTVVLCLLRTI